MYTGILNHIAKRERIPYVLKSAITYGGRIIDFERVDEWINHSALPETIRNTLRTNLTWRAAKIYDYLAVDTPGQMYEQAFSFWRGRNLVRLCGGQEHLREYADVYPGVFAEKMCLWDLHNYLPGDSLTKVDRATMAVSIEGREPLIDHRIAEFAFRLPLNLRRGELGNKHILRKILYKYVPREMIDRPKMGFGIPLLEWLRGDLNYLLDDYLNPTLIKSQGVLDPKLVERTVRAFKRGDAYAVNRVWSLLAFQMWYQRWIC